MGQKLTGVLSFLLKIHFKQETTLMFVTFFLNNVHVLMLLG